MVGQTLGHYQITGQLGSGGMGEVYRAHDTKLGRDVAIKVLPKSFTAQQDRLGRFEHEAKILATLNHPNILVIHDSGIYENAPYLVSEVLDGQTLRDELKNGPLSTRKATDYAIQIAHGLAAAHEKGVVHRDLKPENLFITHDGRVKILDFGLAKLQESTIGPADQTAPPPSDQATLTRMPTEPGVILGTPGYMSPEQVRGAAANERSDIFSFGAILYEMLSGQRAFQGKASVEVMNAILNTQPRDLSEIVPNIPPALDRVVIRCLEKRPEQRFQSASDLAFALENNHSSSGFALAGQRSEATSYFSFARVLPWVAAVFGISIGIYGLLLAWRTSHRDVVQAPPAPTAPPAILRKIGIYVPPPVKLTLAPVVESLSISPDGKKLVYGNADGLWLRHLDQSGPAVLLATPRLPLNQGKPIMSLFWSPDGSEVGYFDALEVCRVPVAGGAPRIICNTESFVVANRNTGAVWGADNRILYSIIGSEVPQGIYQASADGDEPELALAPKGEEEGFRNICALPGGRGVLMDVYRSGHGIDTISLWTGKGDDKVLFQLPNTSLGQLCYAPSGHVVFERLDATGGIWAFPFSLEKLERTGDAFCIAQKGSLPSVADDGTLAFSPADATQTVMRQMIWVDRSGKIVQTLGSPMDSLRSVQLSPDGRRIATISAGADGDDALWVFDTLRDNFMPLAQTTKLQRLANALWYPDGSQLLFSDNTACYSEPVDGFGASQRVLDGWLRDFSRSGKFVFVRAKRNLVPGSSTAPSGSGNNSNAWAWAEMAGKDTKLQPFPEGLNPQDVALSPDESLLAYSSNEMGQNEVFVVSFPGFNNKVRVSGDGGGRMQWRPDGSELYYLSLDRSQLWSAQIKRDGGLQIGAAAKVCDLPVSTYSSPPVGATALFQVTPDAQRFLMLQTPPDPADSSNQQKVGALLVENWLEEFRQNH